MAYIVIAYIVMAYIVVAYIVMAHIVMAHIVIDSPVSGFDFERFVLHKRVGRFLEGEVRNVPSNVR